MGMEIFENINTIVSAISGVLSLVMFFLSKKETEKCEEIKNQIEQTIIMSNKNTTVESNDRYDINNVNTFDNRKWMK